MARRKTSIVVGVFNTVDAAREAVDELVDAGFKRESIGVISRSGKLTKAAADDGMWEEGAAVGVATGAGVGALWALGIAAGVLPGIGPVISGGILASVLASAVGGAAVAGIVGALIGLGIPEEEATYYEGEFKVGKTLVTVRAGNRATDAARIVVRNGGYHRHEPTNGSTIEAAPATPVRLPKARTGGRPRVTRR